MNIAEVMEELATRLKTISGLRVSAEFVGSPNPPHAIVALPRGDFDKTYGRGMDVWELPIVVVVGKVREKTARNNASPYVAGSGDRSVKQVLEDPAYEYESLDTLRVQGFEFDVYTFGGVDYLAAEFILDIAGDGATS